MGSMRILCGFGDLGYSLGVKRVLFRLFFFGGGASRFNI